MSRDCREGTATATLAAAPAGCAELEPAGAWYSPGLLAAVPGRYGTLLSVAAASPLGSRLLTGASWSLAGAFLSQGLNLATFLICARALGRVAYGHLAMLQSTVSTLGIFAGIALGTTATKYVAECRSRHPERAGGIVALVYGASSLSAGLLCAALWATAPTIARRLLNAPELSAGLQVGAAWLFFNVVNGVQSGVLAGFEDFRRIAQLNALRGIATLSITAGAVAAWKLPGAVWGLAVSAAASCVVNRIAIGSVCAARGIGLNWRAGWQDRSLLASFSLPALLTQVISVPTVWAGNAMLARRHNGYAELGLYNAAWQWGNAIGFLPYYLCQPLLSILANLRAHGEVGSLRRLVATALALVLSLSAAAALAVVAGSKWIVLAYGPSFAALGPVLIMVAVAAILSPVAVVMNQVFASMSRMWYGALFGGLWAASYLSVSLLLLPRYGAVGLAGALLAASAIGAVTLGLSAKALLGPGR